MKKALLKLFADAEITLIYEELMRDTGIEPVYIGWKPIILPLN